MIFPPILQTIITLEGRTAAAAAAVVVVVVVVMVVVLNTTIEIRRFRCAKNILQIASNDYFMVGL